MLIFEIGIWQKDKYLTQITVEKAVLEGFGLLAGDSISVLFTAAHIHTGEQRRSDPPESRGARGLLTAGRPHVHIV